MKGGAGPGRDGGGLLPAGERGSLSLLRGCGTIRGRARGWEGGSGRSLSHEPALPCLALPCPALPRLPAARLPFFSLSPLPEPRRRRPLLCCCCCCCSRRRSCPRCPERSEAAAAEDARARAPDADASAARAPESSLPRSLSLSLSAPLPPRGGGERGREAGSARARPRQPISPGAQGRGARERALG